MSTPERPDGKPGRGKNDSSQRRSERRRVAEADDLTDDDGWGEAARAAGAEIAQPETVDDEWGKAAAQALSRSMDTVAATDPAAAEPSATADSETRPESAHKTAPEPVPKPEPEPAIDDDEGWSDVAMPGEESPQSADGTAALDAGEAKAAAFAEATATIEAAAPDAAATPDATAAPDADATAAPDSDATAAPDSDATAAPDADATAAPDSVAAPDADAVAVTDADAVAATDADAVAATDADAFAATDASTVAAPDADAVAATDADATPDTDARADTDTDAALTKTDDARATRTDERTNPEGPRPSEETVTGELTIAVASTPSGPTPTGQARSDADTPAAATSEPAWKSTGRGDARVHETATAGRVTAQRDSPAESRSSRSDRSSRAPDKPPPPSEPSPPRNWRRTLVAAAAAAMAVTALVVGVAGWLNSDTYYLSCGDDRITADKGRFLPPWGRSALQGDEWATIALPADARCPAARETEYIDQLRDWYRDILLEQVEGWLVDIRPRGEGHDRVATIEAQLDQALLLNNRWTGITDSAAGRVDRGELIGQLRGDIEYWRARDHIAAAAAQLDQAAASLAGALERGPKHADDARAWQRFIKYLSGRLARAQNEAPPTDLAGPAADATQTGRLPPARPGSQRSDTAGDSSAHSGSDKTNTPRPRLPATAEEPPTAPSNPANPGQGPLI